MVKGYRIDVGLYKRYYQKDSPKTLGTRVSCKTSTGLDGQRARRAKGKTGIGLDEHRATHT